MRHPRVLSRVVEHRRQAAAHTSPKCQHSYDRYSVMPIFTNPFDVKSSFYTDRLGKPLQNLETPSSSYSSTSGAPETILSILPSS